MLDYGAHYRLRHGCRNAIHWLSCLFVKFYTKQNRTGIEISAKGSGSEAATVTKGFVAAIGTGAGTALGSGAILNERPASPVSRAGAAGASEKFAQSDAIAVGTGFTSGTVSADEKSPKSINCAAA